MNHKLRSAKKLVKKYSLYYPFFLFIILCFVSLSSSDIKITMVSKHNLLHSSLDDSRGSAARTKKFVENDIETASDRLQKPVPTPEPQMNPAWKDKLVAIDAGHGGSDPGTEGFGIIEKNVSLNVANKLDAILKSVGINTLMVRTEDKYMGINTRTAIANGANASLMISIHCDSYKDATMNGTTTLFYYTKTLKKGNIPDGEFAIQVNAELAKVLETKSRGLSQRTDLGVLKYTYMPSVIVELGFLSNENDARIIATEEFKQKAAEAMSEGVKKTLEKLK